MLSSLTFWRESKQDTYVIYKTLPELCFMRFFWIVAFFQVLQKPHSQGKQLFHVTKYGGDAIFRKHLRSLSSIKYITLKESKEINWIVDLLEINFQNLVLMRWACFASPVLTIHLSLVINWFSKSSVDLICKSSFDNKLVFSDHLISKEECEVNGSLQVPRKG